MSPNDARKAAALLAKGTWDFRTTGLRRVAEIEESYAQVVHKAGRREVFVGHEWSRGDHEFVVIVSGVGWTSRYDEKHRLEIVEDEIRFVLPHDHGYASAHIYRRRAS